MKKIAFIKNSYTVIGGIDMQILRIAKYLNDNKHYEPVLITNKLGMPLPNKFISLGYKVFVVNMSDGSVIKCAFEIRKILINNNINIIQSHMFRESIVCRITKLLSPNIVHYYRVETYINCSWIPRYKKCIYYMLDTILQMYVNNYIINGEYIRKEINNNTLIKKSKIVNIPNGCPQIGKINNNTFDHQATIKIAMIANITPHKGHDVLIKAIGELKNKHIPVIVMCYGGDLESKLNHNNSYKEYLKELVNKHNVVEEVCFCGYSENIYDIIDKADIIVLPSDSEGMPMCLLEAMSVGKIIVASNVGGIPEMITHCYNGMLHSKQDYTMLANIIEKIWNNGYNEYTQMRINAYKTWQEYFAMESMMNKFMDIYRNEHE